MCFYLCLPWLFSANNHNRIGKIGDERIRMSYAERLKSPRRSRDKFISKFFQFYEFEPMPWLRPWYAPAVPAIPLWFQKDSRFETVVVLFTKAVQFMNFPKRLSAIFIGSTAVLCALDKHILFSINHETSQKSQRAASKAVTSRSCGRVTSQH